jgi:hypothetical protein
VSNLTQPAGYPYALKDPVPHDDLNDICEQYAKAPNADDGSAHAPTGDLEWSGVGGGGFKFDTTNPFPFYGYLDVSSALRLTAPVSGAVVFDELVALDVLGPLTLKTGFSAAVTLESGVVMTLLSGATCTIATGATCNLSGSTLVRGTLTIKASGGPGSFVVEAGTTCSYAGSATYALTHSETWAEGAEINGVVTRKGGEIRDGASARTMHRPVVDLTDANADVTIAADRYNVPLTITANRVLTARHTASPAPRDGERIKFTRGGTTAPSATHTVKLKREDGTVLFTWGSLRCGSCVIEWNDDAGYWELVTGISVAVGTSGWYDDVWT